MAFKRKHKWQNITSAKAGSSSEPAVTKKLPEQRQPRARSMTSRMY